MARIRNGILGGFNGKVGEVIGQNYAGVSTMRAMPKYVTNPRTPAQEAHRTKMAYASAFFKTFSYVLDFSTWAKSSVVNGFNATLHKNFDKFGLDENDNPIVDLYSLVLGEYPGEAILDPEVTLEQMSNGSNVLNGELAWDAKSFSQWESPDDPVFLFAVMELGSDQYLPLCAIDTGSTRQDQHVNFSISVPSEIPDGTFIDFAVCSVAVTYTTKARNPQKPRELINIPAKNVTGFSAGSALKQKKSMSIPAKNVVRFSAASTLRKAVSKKS